MIISWLGQSLLSPKLRENHYRPRDDTTIATDDLLVAAPPALGYQHTLPA
jgi:hypothetical protein